MSVEDLRVSVEDMRLELHDAMVTLGWRRAELLADIQNLIGEIETTVDTPEAQRDAALALAKELAQAIKRIFEAAGS